MVRKGIIMKRTIYKLTVFALVLAIAAALLPASPVAAEDFGEITFGETYYGEISAANPSDSYTVVLPEAGTLTVIVNSPDSSRLIRIELLDGIGTLVARQTDLRLLSISANVEAGSYSIAVSRGSGSFRTYEICVDFAAAGRTATEPVNNSRETAYLLASDQIVNGFLSFQRQFETYKVILPQASKLTIDVTSPNNSRLILIALYDESGTRVGRQTDLRLLSISANLEAGTYFVEVSKGSGPSDRIYTITARYTTTAVFEISASPSPPDGGSVIGGDTYPQNASVTLRATPSEGYTFGGWYEDDTRVSGSASYTFNAIADRALEARFTQTQSALPTPIVPNPHSSWAEEELERAIGLGLLPDSLADPGIDLRQPITRVEFAGVAVRTYEILANTTALPALVNPFTDTQSIDALKAYNTGIMVGVSGTEFAPGVILNRETAATALTRVFKRSTIPGWTYATDADYSLEFTRPAPFADDWDISVWARDSVYFMAANDIIRGTGNNMFAPRATTTAQQAEGYANATREAALLMALRIIENLG